MGHVRGDHFDDLQFPMQIGNNVVTAGSASAHHVWLQ